MNDDNNQDRIRDAADKILMGEFVRLANDYKQGKRLTGGERSFVQRMAADIKANLSNKATSEVTRREWESMHGSIFRDHYRRRGG